MKKKKIKELENLTFKQRIKKNLGWLIAYGAFAVTGFLLIVILPKIKYKVPNYQTSVNTTTVTRQGTLEKINQITKIDNVTYKITTDKTYTITLAGIDITEGYTIGDYSYSADDYDLTQFLEDGLYVEKETLIKDNYYTGYIWFSNIDTCSFVELQDYLFNASLIYANFADYNNEDVRYGAELKQINDERPTMNKMEKWILDKIFVKEKREE